MTDKDRDVFMLAVTGCCEASNQGDDGLAAVMHSIRNRHLIGKWYSAKTIAATCVFPYAYSSWNSKDPNRGRVLSMGVADPMFFKCLQIAAGVMDGTINDITSGATHYYSVKQMIDPPDWVPGNPPSIPAATFTVQIKDHKFYKGVQ